MKQNPLLHSFYLWIFPNLDIQLGFSLIIFFVCSSLCSPCKFYVRKLPTFSADFMNIISTTPFSTYSFTYLVLILTCYCWIVVMFLAIKIATMLSTRTVSECLTETFMLLKTLPPLQPQKVRPIKLLSLIKTWFSAYLISKKQVHLTHER